MKPFDDQNYRFKTRSFGRVVSLATRRFSDGRRNVARGIIAEAQRGEISADRINALRDNLLEGDMYAAALMLEAPQGLRLRNSIKRSAEEITKNHHLKALSGRLEAAYACGVMNSWPDETMLALDAIEALATLAQDRVDDNLLALNAVATKWGASNFLSRKVSYLKEFYNLSDAQQLELDQIDIILEHRQHPNSSIFSLRTIQRAIVSILRC